MKFLLVVKQKKNVDTFLDTVRSLLARGHSVTLAVQERHSAQIERLVSEIDAPGFRLAQPPTLRTDAWSEVGPLLRSLADCLHYQQPALRAAEKLQARTIDKLREELRVGAADAEVAGLLRHIPPQQIERLRAVLGLAEEGLPIDPLHDEFLRLEHPDVVLAAPVVHFGSAQADLVASAGRLGIPVGMLLFSWDNLSTKGRLHRRPDWMFVWNEHQRREAVSLHEFPANRVVVVGAPRFDAFFAMRHQLSREEFHRPLGLDPGSPTLLYVCSSPFVSAGELAFVQRWVMALRRSPVSRTCNVIVRPHPDVALLGPDEGVETMRWPARPGLQGFVSRPFADDRAVVLRTSDHAMQGFYECIGHSAAVVGLNTSAELEAAIAGKPVFTVLAGAADADGQATTLHFHYLLEEQGGFVRVAKSLEEHVAQIDAELETPSDAAAIRRFVGEFLRPLGEDRAASPLLAEAIERTFAGSPQEHAAHTGTSPHAVREEPRSASGIESESDENEDGDVPLGERGLVAAGAPRTWTAVAVGRRVSPAADRPVIRLYAPDPAVGGRHRGDKTIAAWLQSRVGIGDVLYDVSAGVGLYSVFAAKHRGATVVAFEPGYAAFKDMCEHLLLNGCDGSVIPIPLALADFEGLGGLKFALGLPGQHRHVVRRESWHARRPSGEGRALVQSSCVTSIDAAVGRYELPPPNHILLAAPGSVGAILSGAKQVLASAALRTIFATVLEEESEALTGLVARSGWHVDVRTPISRGRAHVVFTRLTSV